MGRFTAHNDFEVDAYVKGDLDYILTVTKKYEIEFVAVYLIGGFGRGEGTVFFNGIHWQSVNDYDLLYVVEDCKTLLNKRHAMSIEMAESLSVDFVDIGCLLFKSLKKLNLTMQNYDFKFGSFLLSGSDIRKDLPTFKPGYLPPFEFIRLLCNRCAGLISSETEIYKYNSIYRQNQKVKACIAVGDTFIYMSKGYHHLYRQRLYDFNFLIDNNIFPFHLNKEAIIAIQAAYDAKLYGLGGNIFEVNLTQIKDMISHAFIALAQKITGKMSSSIKEAEFSLRHHFKASSVSGFKLILKTPIKRFLNRNRRMNIGIRNSVLFSLPYFFCCMPQDTINFENELSLRFKGIPLSSSNKPNVDSIFELWETYAH